VTLSLGRHQSTTGVLVTSITDEFILVLDIMHTHDPSVDLGCHVLRLDNEEVPLRRPGAWPLSAPCMKGSSEVVAARYDRLATLRLEELVEAADSLAGVGYRAAHQAKARRPVQPSSEVPVRMTRGHQL
jgi:hypothetical protein